MKYVVGSKKYKEGSAVNGLQGLSNDPDQQNNYQYSNSVCGRYILLKEEPEEVRRQNPITNPEFLKLRFRHTGDIIQAVNNGTFPKQAMLNFHPQRWNDAFGPWVKELVWQNVKNQGKWVLLRLRD